MSEVEQRRKRRVKNKNRMHYERGVACEFDREAAKSGKVYFGE